MCCYNEGYEPRLITNDAPGTQWHIASYDGDLTECHDTNFLLLGASRVARWYACWRLVPAVRRLLPLLSESETAATRVFQSGSVSDT